MRSVRWAGRAAVVGFALAAALAPPRANALDLGKQILRWLRSAAPIADINHRYISPMPSVNDRRIGKSGSFPLALKIVVAKESTGFPAGIGKIVHDALFPNYPPFTFKVLFASAKRNLLGKSDYANPKSIWFNVFFGYYEIVVSKRAWKRPFGYDLSQGQPRVLFEDVVRLGKADWNHFSNQLYGVPKRAIEPFDKVDMNEVRIEPARRVRVGSRGFDLVQISGVRVVSPYRSKYDGGKFEDLQKPIGIAWRYAFGTYDRDHPDIRTSFGASSMRARFYMSFKEERDSLTGERVYKTYMYGGTVNEAYPNRAENNRFLNLQMKSLQRILARERSLGFPLRR